jgi:hypothetical protein
MDAKLRQQLRALLGVVDEHDTRGSRLLDDAMRFWQRVQRLLAMNVISGQIDVQGLELACYGLQLPMRSSRLLPIGRLGRLSLRDRAEQAAELMVTVLGPDIEEGLMDRTTRLLHEMPQRSPMLDEARLLADAVNLDDFGVTGMAVQAIQLARQGESVAQLADGCQKRQQYGYWEARLKDGFHFDLVRKIAQRRLENARLFCKLLVAELEEDRQ